MKFLGYFEVDQKSITGSTDSAGIRETVYLNNRKASELFYNKKLNKIATGDVFLMQVMDGTTPVGEVTPVRVTNVYEYIVNDANVITSLILGIVKEGTYFDRTYTGSYPEISIFEEYAIYKNALAIVVHWDPEDISFGDKYSMIRVGDKNYMYVRTANKIGTRIDFPDENGNPGYQTINDRIVVLYSTRAAYSNYNCEVALSMLKTRITGGVGK